MSLSRRFLVVAVAAALAPSLWAQDAPPPKNPTRTYTTPPSILLARSWPEAIKEATIRNVPILFTTALAT